ncbi:uncharacterized protein LOC132800255 isoform X2 [Ziziphus jujuba]|uniref:Uncharacterized protein LOC132800255 isoform X2 n=1 Tax=Ziziphus jujuba TaxID=326968 RepID=A0ABM3ZYI3_ZIZJJ|nr:uncharacterized protein LOC132800255 isoform X2 [Ziziphus jujuba]
MVICQRQEMRNLKDLCPWNRTFMRMSHVAPFKGCMVGGIDSSIEEICKPTIGGSMQLRNGKAVGLVPNDLKPGDMQEGNKDFVGELSVTIVDAQKLCYFFYGKTESLDPKTTILVPKDRYGLHAVDTLDPDMKLVELHLISQKRKLDQLQAIV